MPRKQKPAGYEKWTWEEIRVDHRMSKGEKRMRRIAKSFGGTEGSDGRINAPNDEQRPLYIFVMTLMAIMTFGVILFAPKGCAHEEKEARRHAR